MDNSNKPIDDTASPIKLINKDGTMSCIKFKCYKSNKTYTVVSSKLGGIGALKTIDTLVRCDDERLSIERGKLVKRFDQIQPIKIFYEGTANKRSKNKRRKKKDNNTLGAKR